MSKYILNLFKISKYYIKDFNIIRTNYYYFIIILQKGKQLIKKTNIIYYNDISSIFKNNYNITLIKH